MIAIPESVAARTWIQRSVRFWSGHLLLLNAGLCTLVWLLYGNPALYGHGAEYVKLSRDFSPISQQRDLSNEVPGLENVLLPGVAAGARRALMAIGLEYTDTTFVLVASLPYPLFIYGLTRLVQRRSRPLAMATAIALYTSGMIPYMTSWGGYADGLSYLLLLPVFLWPESLAVYLVTFALQCANHYLGAIMQVLWAFVWYSSRALDEDAGLTFWLKTFVLRAILSAAILAGVMGFWQAHFPEDAGLRRQLLLQQWQRPRQMLLEVALRFPWTLISTFKLVLLPVLAWIIAARPALRRLIYAAPLVAGVALTFAFLDITRVSTMLIMPAFVMAVLAARHDTRLRKLVIVTALLNLLIPNFYVNNAIVVVPESRALRWIIARAAQ